MDENDAARAIAVLLEVAEDENADTFDRVDAATAVLDVAFKSGKL